MQQTPAIRVAVLNPNGRDPFLDYTGPLDGYRQGVHPPINFHAYAAATRGAFFDSTSALMESTHRFDACLVLIRRRTWLTLEAVKTLKAAGHRVLVAWKECGPYQIANQLDSDKAVAAYEQILLECDGILSATQIAPPRLGDISPAGFHDKLTYMPTPYPIEDRQWDYSVEPSQRSGILIGTRDFSCPFRNHLRALTVAADLSAKFSTHVTVINSQKRTGRRVLKRLASTFQSGQLRIVEGTLPYDQYLQLIASHRFVFQLDQGHVPGQVAGDTLLCRSICVGGNSAIEAEVFPDFSTASNTEAQILKKVLELFDEKTYATAIERSHQLGRQKVGYEAVAGMLAEAILPDDRPANR